jgi:cell division protein FtsN
MRSVLSVAAALHLLPAGAALAQTSPTASPAASTYAVQVAGQRTEAEARLAFQALQVKYPADLRGRDIVVRRVEQASGAWYQGEIGPFGAASEADAFCDRLMAAGGACVVVLASQTSAQTSTTVPAAAAAPPPAAPAASEPRRVKTTVIRPDNREPSQSVPVAPQPGANAEPKRVKTLSVRPSRDGAEAARPPGAYMVQVSAQRSEDEARSAYRALQQKYPSVLGGRELVIRKVELADAGAWYRGQVGPFDSLGEADGFCQSLKAAGGQCIVHRN